MKLTVCSITLALGMTVSSIAMAQSNDAETPTTETPAAETPATEAPATPAESSPEAGAEAEAAPAQDETFPVASDEAPTDGEPQVGQEFVRETHGDWQVRCIKGDETDACSLYQLLNDSDGNSVAEFNVVALPKGSQAVAGVTFITPLGTLLPSGAKMRIDSGKVRSYEFSWCEKSGCISRFGLPNSEMNALKKGANAVMTITSVGAPDKPIPLAVSLSGITAAWDAIAPK
ncbi:hypothetical protein GCM10008927_03580 [Amylibacter ulvae]|uniref:Invasion associated locus B family protein n=1 Tax=Paramylibacter ulvae TaxID=1651968 RepID=A0ABQ3CYK3_9RHOB|nr:invasion associated locus B family protein [Amylibacter ulvae]GHA42402.1 hypothetical protein GCM10008927_03580 [Amylibacter ulvae]